MEKATPRRYLARLTSLVSISALAMALSACGGGSGGDGGATPADPPAPPAVVPPPAFVGLQDFSPAVMVLGQPEFTTGAGNGGTSAPSGATLLDPAGVAITPDGMVFISDSANRRVLGFNNLRELRGQAADFVLGQPDAFQGGPTGESDAYFSPKAISYGAGKIAVVDSGAHRVLIYTSIPTNGTARPTVVVGQSGFDDEPDTTCDRAHLSSPKGVHITPDGKLIVADSGHSRVLVWNQVPGEGEHGRDADVVLGQSGFTNCAANAGGTTPRRDTMRQPDGVWSDGSRLAVVDTLNHRVLLWDNLTTEEVGQLPARVVGQADFDTAQLGAPTAGNLAFPRAVSSNGQHLAVSDSGHNRVLLWGEWPSQDGQEAISVLGQRDFFHETFNDEDGDNFDDGAPTARTLNAPFGITFHQDKLLVVDESNNRLLMFQSD